MAAFGGYVTTPDGQRFIAVLSQDQEVHRPLTIISDWLGKLLR